MKQPTVLIVLDGWGIAPDNAGNAITRAHLSYLPTLTNIYPHTTLDASGLAVGLPEHESGNSETGHINIGAGRVVDQDLSRINRSIADGTFFANDAFIGATRHAKQHNSNLHIIGVLSSAGVHASSDHLCALLKLMEQQSCQHVYLHLFMDGRDMLPRSAKPILERLSQHCMETNAATIATIMGRYYGMDRDRRWERTERAYQALTMEVPLKAKSAIAAVDAAYERGETDEFIQPTVITDEHGVMLPRIANNDAVIFFNFRIDRPRQLTRALVYPDFETHVFAGVFDPYAEKYFHKHTVDIESRSHPFHRSVILNNLFFVTMTEYERHTPCVVAYPPYSVSNGLAETVALAKMRQLHASESEKERFVTYYFNGLKETPYPNEDRVIVPSPSVATYDLAPQMSAIELTDKVIDRLRLGVYGFVVVNFANPDMVGHTGSIQKAMEACLTIDTSVKKIVQTVLELDGNCFITADHGNVEEMLTSSQEIDTEHSHNPVPLICCSNRWNGHPVILPTGALADIAPTVLGAMGIPIPTDMTGKNLLANAVL